MLARCLGIPLILLCSTDDPVTRATWLRLGFCFTSQEDLKRFGVGPRDLLHMDNTVQVWCQPGCCCKGAHPGRLLLLGDRKAVTEHHQLWILREVGEGCRD